MPTVTDGTKLAELLGYFQNPRKCVKWTDDPTKEMLRCYPHLSQPLVNETVRKYLEDGGRVNAVDEKEPTQRAMGKKEFYELRITISGEPYYVKGRVLPGPPSQFYVMSFHEEHEKREPNR